MKLSPAPIGKYFYKKMPPQVRKYLKDFLGEEEYKKLMSAIDLHRWVIMSGPVCSGKSTVAWILKSIGYPYVLDEGDEAFIIHTPGKLSNPIPTCDILESLGVGKKH